MFGDYKPHGLFDHPVDPKRCKASVAGGRATIHQCLKPRGADGYCAVHGQKGQEARAKKSAERSRVWNLKFDLSGARADVVEAALRVKVFTDGPEARRLQKAVEKLKKLQSQLSGGTK